VKSTILKLLSLLLVGLLLSPTSSASGFEEWHEGDEEEITGHSFDEEYWTAEVTNETENGSATFGISYVNYEDVQAFLVALKNVTNPEGEKGILPYQLFGMHYYTPKGREVFIGAIFAFLMAYNDTNGNHIQDPGNEPVYYIMPFGLSVLNDSWVPSSSVMSVQNPEEGHYRFGMTYQNLYAFATPVPGLVMAALASGNPLTGLLALLTTYVVKFTELQITYDINIDSDTNTVSAETFYTLGQVTELYPLWQYVLGMDSLDVSDALTEDWGISAVHYVSVFTSRYVVQDASGNTLNTKIDQNMTENITINVGDDYERAFEIGYRGTYDVINEETSTTIIDDANAYNIMLQARLADLLLVWWQLGFSGKLFSVFSYALSDNIQDEYSSPKDLSKKWWMNIGHSASLWYAVSFPSWQGYRVEHDPVYTAYFAPAPAEPAEEEEGICGLGGLVFFGAVCIPSANALSKRRKKKL
jgi:hypothetical protein